MSAALEMATTRTAETLGDLLRRLGDISPDRVRLHPSLGSATEADVIAIDAKEDRLFELVDGVLVEKCMGFRESMLAAAIGAAIRGYVVPRKLGLVTGAAGTIMLFDRHVRIPGVAYVSWDRIPGRKVPSAPVPLLAPDLVVEVLRVSNSKKEMAKKREEYFSVGVRLVWEVDPQTWTVQVYSAPERHTVLTENEVLDGGEVLPGFTLVLRDLFAELDG
jgi:Uma2 family endonuclease